MRQIGVRELKAHTSEVLRRVAEGETYEVTSRGKIVALLTHPGDSSLEKLCVEDWEAHWDALVNEIAQHLDPAVPLNSVEILRGGRDW